MRSIPILSRTMKAIAVLGLAAALTACASVPSIGASASSTSTTGGQAASTNRTGQGAPGVTGEVMSVSGNTFDVQVPNQTGPYTLVQLSSNTQILKQATTTLSSLKAGTGVIATGTEANGVLTATTVRVLGQGGDRAGGPPANGTPRAGGAFQRTGNGQGGQGNGGQGNGRGNGSTTVLEGSGGGSNVFGTVDSVSADGLTIKAANGTTTQVKLAPNAQVTVEEAGTVSDITQGSRVVVVGSAQNGTVTATRVQIVPAAAQGQ